MVEGINLHLMEEILGLPQGLNRIKRMEMEETVIILSRPNSDQKVKVDWKFPVLDALVMLHNLTHLDVGIIDNWELVSSILECSPNLQVLACEKVNPSSEALSCSLDLDYNEAASELDRIYKLSPTTIESDTEDHDDQVINRVQRGRRKISDANEKPENRTAVDIVRGQHKRLQRFSLEKRIQLKNKKDVAVITSNQKRKHGKVNEDEEVNRLI
ncbi:hypothetical protein Ccrd_026579 [Cynara cardunculus var. scolymus]|uniref:Uncharacterized protein n=1 Tax=Cynara cardunculus var. scolymus TaxID=59895 RepID=A0A103N3A5_CYNCS|nr:hypothetical protein Ccrd_026579 [Cynara cardunculus var. scolymus]